MEINYFFEVYMQNTKKRSWFTLIEILIVVSILAVLWAIWFLAFSHYSASARDTTRKTDAANINKILELYRVWKGKYAYPSDSHKVVVGSTPIWTQGVFGTGSQKEIGKLLWELKDPRFENFYAYSTTNSQTEYQLWVIYEKEWISEDIPNLTFWAPSRAYAAWIAPIPNPANPDISFWYDGQDMDNDGKNDANDSVIANVWLSKNVVPTEFNPFYFNRVIWLDGQDVDGNLQPDTFDDGEEITSWVNKTWAWFNGFVPQTGNNHSNPSASSPPNYQANAFGSGKNGVYFNGVSKWDRIVIDRGTQPKWAPFSLAYTFKINDANGNSAEDVWTNHATIISVWPSWGWEYYRKAWGWQLSRDGRANNFIFRINGNIPEANKTYFNGANCLKNNGNNTCGTSWSNAEIAFWDWSEVNDNQDHTVIVTFDGTKITGYLDGTKRFEAIMEDGTDPYGEYFRFFWNRAGTAYLEGVLWEVFIADEKISFQDIEKIEWYFANKWGYSLSPSHPYSGVPLVEMWESSEIEYTRYEGTGEAYTSFDLETFLSQNPAILDSDEVRYPGSMNAVNIRENNKTHIWKWIMKVSETGSYTFETASDDYSFVQIADAEDPSSNFQTIVDNGWAHSVVTRNGSLNLIKDRAYEFMLIYGQIWGNASLDFRVDGPGVVSYRKHVAPSWYDKSSGSSVKNLEQTDNQRVPSYNPLNYSMNFENDTYYQFPSASAPFAASDNWQVFAVVEISDSSEEGVGWYIFENDSSTEQWTLAFWTRGIQAGSTWFTWNDITGKQFQVVSYEFNQVWDTQKYFIGWQMFLNESSDLSGINGEFYLWWKELWFTGELREIMWYTTILTDEQREEVEWYLSQKWGLAHKLRIDHPYYEPRDTWEEIYVEVTGNYNGIFTHGNVADNHLVVASPSILSSQYAEEWTTVAFSSLVGENRLVYNGYRNIPWPYLWVDEVSEKLTEKDGFFFNYNNTTVFEGSKEELASYRWISEIDDHLRLIYTNSYLHEYVSDKFEKNNVNYVKEILQNIIGINPIVPFYCKDILDSSRWINVALSATLDGNAWTLLSKGLATVNDGVITPDGQDYSYLTNPDSPTDKSVSLSWASWIEQVSLIKIHNAFGEYSKNLRYGNLKIINEYGQVVYTHVFWDTNDESIIKIEPIITVAGKIQEIILTPLEYDQVWLREIEVFSGKKAESGTYKVDDDGVWWKSSYEVYCDMLTDGGGWTKVGNNYVYNGTFADGQHALNWAWTYSAQSSILNTNNPGSSNFVLRQSSSSGNNSSIEYKIDVENTEAMKAGRELRFRAWMRYDGWNIHSANPFNYSIVYEWGWVGNTWEIKTLKTEVIAWDVWKQKEMRLILEKDVSSFSWRVGRDIEKSPSKSLYLADLELEIYFQ